MTLFERFTNLWTKDQDTRIEALMEANAGMHDVVNDEREKREACERDLRPFREYVEASDAMAAAAAADAARERDEAPTEEGNGAAG